MRRAAPAFIAVVLLGSAAGAQAGFISGNADAGQSGLGNFSGSITYAPSTSTTATLTVNLTNTSPTANGGFLTAFVLNNPNNRITGIALSSAPANFGLIGSAPFANGTLNAAPYGQFAFGAATGGGFEGGGPPSRGLAAGASGVFVFALTGTNLNTLTDASFASTLSAGSGGGSGYQFFVARFRGFNDDGSDKVPATATPSAVPEPSSLALSGLATLVGVGTWFRRRRQTVV